MHDDRVPVSPQPPDWTAAFAALPLETPEADSWSHIVTAVPLRRRVRWPKWMAVAAVLAMAAVAPWRWLQEAPVGVGEANPTAPAAPSPVQVARVAAHVETRSASVPSAAPARRPASPGPVVASRDADAGTVRSAKSPSDPAAARASRRVTPRIDAHGKDRRHFIANSTRSPGASDSATAAGTRWPRTNPELERLYAESAQLEALVTMARDDRVASGAATVLASAYDAQVANIDASLREPAVGEDERARLWHQRVDALRQLAGFESTQRALAAQGERYDAMLVSID